MENRKYCKEITAAAKDLENGKPGTIEPLSASPGYLDLSEEYYEIVVSVKCPDDPAVTDEIFRQKVSKLNLQRLIGAINAPEDYTLQPPPFLKPSL